MIVTDYNEMNVEEIVSIYENLNVTFFNRGWKNSKGELRKENHHVIRNACSINGMWNLPTFCRNVLHDRLYRNSFLN